MAQIPPFSPQTPWLAEDKSTVNFPHAQLLIALQRSASVAPQIATVPATATASGQAGSLAFDANFLYVCVANNSWKRVALTSF